MERTPIGNEVHLFVIQSHLLQDGRLEIADVVRRLNGPIADLVGRTFDDATPDAASCKQALADVLAIMDGAGAKP